MRTYGTNLVAVANSREAGQTAGRSTVSVLTLTAFDSVARG